MTIKAIEELTGLSRSNIRFYEKEELIQLLKQQKLELERQQAELHNAQLICEKNVRI